MTEKILQSKKFEQNQYSETEQKFLPLFPEKLDKFRLGAVAIEQVYLSHPSENFHLRLRRELDDGVATYTATLKDTGNRTDNGLQRLEVTGNISAERFDFYNQDVPIIRKFRAEPHQDIAIDYFDDGHIHVESENPESWRQFIEDYGLENDFVDVTGDRTVDNEWRAHASYRRQHDGHEAFAPKPELDIDEIMGDIFRKRSELITEGLRRPVVSIGIGGRSGSGKSTIVKAIQQKLERFGLSSAALSTDDYNRGSEYLRKLGGGTWTNFDDDRVYNLERYATHIEWLRFHNEAAPRLQFNPKREETEQKGWVQPADIIIGEGIKSGHHELRSCYDLYYELPTPIATSIGRRILRDLTERPRFAKPSVNLEYMLEYTEPAHRALEK